MTRFARFPVTSRQSSRAQALQKHHIPGAALPLFQLEFTMSSRPWFVALLLLIPGSLLPAQTPDRAALVRKQEDQERARAMTRSLLDGVLQLQLRQLEENGLTDLPVYRDIGLMREHLQEIVDQ
ncbi:MAG: hypothetical protein B7Z55_13560, partial [Planctomycetales bacterium 12-60-4]